MKKISYLLVMIIVSVVMTSVGCKKKNDNNTPDPTTSFTLAKVGHLRVYRITNLKGSCEYNVEVTKDLGNGVYELTYQQGTCAWNLPTSTTYMFCTPEEWGSVFSLNPLNVQINLRTDAKVGTVYTWINPPDTILVTVLNLTDNVTVQAGKFECIKVRKDGKMYFGGDTLTFASYYWITYKYGLVKLENIFGNPGQDQELVSANW